MARRSYRMDKRAAAAAETRQRIVEACFHLHGRQGIAATTMAQIAEQAGVGAGTVYHHFPTYDAMVAACGAHAAGLLTLPGPDVLDGCEGLQARLEALARAVFGLFGSARGLALIRADRESFAPVDGFFTAEEANRTALARAALEPLGFDDRAVRLAAAMLDLAVHDGLVRAGFTTEQAAEAVAGILAAGLPAAR